MTQKSAPAPTQQQMRVITSQLEVYARDLRRLLDLERGRAHDLARANKRLGLLDGLKQDFLRFIAHELRTPLEALTALELVDLTKPEEASELIGFAREGYVRLTAFVERGLAYFHSLSLDPRSDERTSLALVLALLLSDRARFPPGAFELELAPDLDDVAGSDKSLGEVLGVLLDNALKFGPPDGRPPARIAARVAADGVVVEVSDHGVGFRPELGPELVRPFTVGNAAHHRSGTGLSLSLARAIVEAHGGALELASEGPGRGACATVRLRRAAPSEAGAVAPLTGAITGSAARPTVNAPAQATGSTSERALLEAQLMMYAKDFKRVVELERVRRQALEAAQLQLERYATDLNQATRAERERARHGGDAQRRALSLVMRVAGLTHAPTLAHQSRMEGYVLVLTRRLGWSVADTYALAAAAELHDLGLCKVPLAILDQADPLDVPSLEVLRRHPVSGAELLAGDDSPFGALARSVARHHHERWDGSGYPDGLAGPDIPLPARIVAVADVYDALRDTRPYRAGLSHDEARRALLDGDRKSQPRHFDPAVLDAFEQSHEDFDRVWRQLTAAASERR